MTGTGTTIAEILTGSWRLEPPPADFGTAELASTQRQMMASGGAGLAWWRIRNEVSLRESAEGSLFHDAFRMHTLHAGLNEDHIERVFEELRSEGVEPLLFKGWDAARMYPEPGLRPYGDIDLLVRPSQVELASRVLAGFPEGERADVHHDIETRGLPLETLFQASRFASLSNGFQVRVPCEEDRLRLLALHTLKHGAWRPLWLCDVAGAVEGRSENFDWSRCLTADRVVRDWALTAVALAGQLLRADVSGTPAAGRALPKWPARRVLAKWSVPFPERYGVVLEPLPSLSRPLSMVRALPKRWEDPVAATLAMGVRFSGFPPIAFQVAYSLRRSAHYLARPSHP